MGSVPLLEITSKLELGFWSRLAKIKLYTQLLDPQASSQNMEVDFRDESELGLWVCLAGKE